MAWYKILVGALALIGGGAWYLLKKAVPLSFDAFCKECIDEAKRDVKTISYPEVVKSIVILTSKNSKDVEPFIYKRYADGSVTKKLIHSSPFPLDLCPKELVESIKKGEYIIETL